jgi:hypothetical protein
MAIKYEMCQYLFIGCLFQDRVNTPTFSSDKRAKQTGLDRRQSGDTP